MSDLDTDQPSPTRVYDYFLGGSCNFEVDRMFARELLQRVPWAQDAVRLNRAFLLRAVRFCASQGIRQFLEIGSGCLTTGTVHESALAIDSSARTVYVERDPVVVAQAELLLEGTPNANMIEADFLDVTSVFGQIRRDGLLDLDQPIAVLMASVVHYLEDADNPGDVIAGYLREVVPGSYLVFSHACSTGVPEEIAVGARMYQRTSAKVIPRSRARIAEFFTGLELVEPGLVFTCQWQPEEVTDQVANPGRAGGLAGVARKPQETAVPGDLVVVRQRPPSESVAHGVPDRLGLKSST